MKMPFIIADYLKGKTIYPVVRRFLTLLFSLSITSFLFENFYFSYTWPDITDYKLILNFFVRGHFIVPFCIFLVVHGLTYSIPSIFFSLYSYRKSMNNLKKLIAFEIRNHNIEREIGKMRALSSNLSPITINKDMLVELYLGFKDHLSPEVLDELDKECEKSKENLELNFIFAFRAIVTIIIFFNIIPYFGWFLFLASTIILLLYMILLLVGNQFFDIVPMAIRKFKYEADKYVTDYLANKPVAVTNQ